MVVDHNILSFAIFLLATVIAIIGVMLKGWFKHVNDNLERLWDRIDEESKARQGRWDNLHDKCEVHSAQIAELKGRMNGKKAIMEGKAGI